MIRFVCKTKIILSVCKEQIEIGSGVNQSKLNFARKRI